jgi:hypothetical protein
MKSMKITMSERHALDECVEHKMVMAKENVVTSKASK